MSIQEYTITFQPLALKVRAHEGESILQAARRGGIHINASCGGAGLCGKCRVTVEQGQVKNGISEKLSQGEKTR